MKSLWIMLFSVLVSSPAFAMMEETFTINCGDVHAGYADIDVSDRFKADFAQSIVTAQVEGQKKSFGGRNCFGNIDANEVEYEVLILMDREQPLLRDLVQPFGVAKARISLQIMDPNVLKYGLVLLGEGSNLQSTDGSVTAKLSLARTVFFSNITMIIRQK